MVSACDGLSDHVAPNINDKVWRGDYINLAVHLPHTSVTGPETEINSTVTGFQLLDKTSATKDIKNMNQWTDVFLIYTDIYIQNTLPG